MLRVSLLRCSFQSSVSRPLVPKRPWDSSTTQSSLLRTARALFSSTSSSAPSSASATLDSTTDPPSGERITLAQSRNLLPAARRRTRARKSTTVSSATSAAVAQPPASEPAIATAVDAEARATLSAASDNSTITATSSTPQHARSASSTPIPFPAVASLNPAAARFQPSSPPSTSHTARFPPASASRPELSQADSLFSPPSPSTAAYTSLPAHESTYVSHHYHIDVDDVHSYLRRKQLSFRSTADQSQLLIRDCPFCHPIGGKPDNQWKLTVYMPAANHYCHRCRAKGSWYDMKKRLGDIRDTVTTLRDQPITPHYTKGFPAFKPTDTTPSADTIASSSSSKRHRQPTQSSMAAYHEQLNAYPGVVAWLTEGEEKGGRGLRRDMLDLYKVGAGKFKFISEEGRWVEEECVTFPWMRVKEEKARRRVSRAADGNEEAAKADEAGAGEERREAENTNAAADSTAASSPSSDSANPTASTPTYIIDRIKYRSRVLKTHQRLLPAGGNWGFFGYHTIPASATSVILTEGEFDAIAAHQCTGVPAVSLPNGANSLPVELLPFLERFTRIYLWMDDDRVGQEGAETFAKKLGINRCWIVRTRGGQPDGPKDANDALLQGYDLCDILAGAQPLPHRQITTFEELRDDVWKEIADPQQRAGVQSTSLPSLNSTLKGHRRGELTVITGSTGVGKCFKRGTRLRLYNGNTIAVQDVRGGMLLMGDDGQPRTVTPGTVRHYIPPRATDEEEQEEGVEAEEEEEATDAQMEGVIDLTAEAEEAADEPVIEEDEEVEEVRLSGWHPMYKVTPRWEGAKPFTVNGAHILVLTNNVKPHVQQESSRSTVSGKRWAWYRVLKWEVDANNKMVPRAQGTYSTRALAERERDRILATWRPIEWEVSVDDYQRASGHAKDACKLVACKALTFLNPQLSSVHSVLSTVLGLAPTRAQHDYMAWWLGVWVTDGESSSARVWQGGAQAPDDHHHKEICAELLRYRHVFNNEAVRMTQAGVSTAGWPLWRFDYAPGTVAERVLRAYGLLNNKHVPRALLCDSLDVRRRFLAGLIDGDGYFSAEQNRYEIAAKHKRVIAGYKELAATLGLRNSAIHDTECTNQQTGNVYDGYCIIISGHMWDAVQHCVATYKRCPEPGSIDYVPKNKDTRCYGFDIDEVDPAEHCGFAVHGGVNRRFLLDDYTVTHNTTVLSQLSLDYCAQGVTTLWGSFEIKNFKLAKTMLGQYSGLDFTCNAAQFEHYADQFEQLPMYFMRFFGSSSVEQVLDAMDYAVYCHDVQHVVLDNLQFMLAGQSDKADKFELQDRAINEFRHFATHKNVHITLVIHPRKEADLRPLGVSSVFGSAKATQEADNVIILQAPTPPQVFTSGGFGGDASGWVGQKAVAAGGGGEMDKYRRLQIMKNRYDGEVGVIPFVYDRATGRIQEVDKDGAVKHRAVFAHVVPAPVSVAAEEGGERTGKRRGRKPSSGAAGEGGGEGGASGVFRPAPLFVSSPAPAAPTLSVIQPHMQPLNLPSPGPFHPTPVQVVDDAADARNEYTAAAETAPAKQQQQQHAVSSMRRYQRDGDASRSKATFDLMA